MIPIITSKRAQYENIFVHYKAFIILDKHWKYKYTNVILFNSMLNLYLNIGYISSFKEFLSFQVH